MRLLLLKLRRINMRERIFIAEKQNGDFTDSWNQQAAIYIIDHSTTVNTADAYRTDINYFQKHLQEAEVNSWQEIRGVHVADYFGNLSKQGYSQSTIYRKLASIGGLISSLTENKNIPLSEEVAEALNKARSSESRKPPERTELLFPIDFNKLLEETGNIRDRVILHLLSYGLDLAKLLELKNRYVQETRTPNGIRFELEIPPKDEDHHPTKILLDEEASQAIGVYQSLKEGFRNESRDAQFLLKIAPTTLELIDSPLIQRQSIWLVIKKLGQQTKIDCNPRRLQISNKVLHGQAV